jgi:hypothetical protein
MRGACAADDPWHSYRQKFRVFFREATCPMMLLLTVRLATTAKQSASALA